MEERLREKHKERETKRENETDERDGGATVPFDLLVKAD